MFIIQKDIRFFLRIKMMSPYFSPNVFHFIFIGEQDPDLFEL